MSRRQTVINQTVYYQEGDEQSGGNTGAILLTFVFGAVAIITVPIWGAFWLLWQARGVISTCVLAVARAMVYVLPILAGGVALVGLVYAVGSYAEQIGYVLRSLAQATVYLLVGVAVVTALVIAGKKLLAIDWKMRPRQQPVPQTVVIVVRSEEQARQAHQLLERQGVRALLEQPTQWQVIDGTKTHQSVGLQAEVYQR